MRQDFPLELFFPGIVRPVMAESAAQNPHAASEQNPESGRGGHTAVVDDSDNLVRKHSEKQRHSHPGHRLGAISRSRVLPVSADPSCQMKRKQQEQTQKRRNSSVYCSLQIPAVGNFDAIIRASMNIKHAGHLGLRIDKGNVPTPFPRKMHSFSTGMDETQIYPLPVNRG